MNQIDSINDTHLYVSTLYKSNAVRFSCLSNFLGHFDRDHKKYTEHLVLDKGTRIEILECSTFNNINVQTILEIPIYGKIVSMLVFKPYKELIDYILIVTKKFKYCILTFDTTKKTVITKASGDLRDRIGRPSERGPLISIDSTNRFIFFFIIQGLLKILPIEEGPSYQQHVPIFREAFNVLMEDLQVLDIKWIDSQNANITQLAVLSIDIKKERHIKIYRLDAHKQLQFVHDTIVDQDSHMIISIRAPYYGIIVLSSTKITYLPPSWTLISSMTINIQSTTILTICPLDDSNIRFLLGDQDGQIYVLYLIFKQNQNHQRIHDIKYEKLGNVTIPNTITHLGNGIVFIGSLFGDSQFIQLLDTRSENESFILELQKCPNPGPITDFVIADVGGKVYGQLVACCGAFNEGSLRIIQSGLTFGTCFSVPLSFSSNVSNDVKRQRLSNDHLPIIERLFSLSLGRIALCFSFSSTIIKIEHAENDAVSVSGIELNGWNYNSRTIASSSYNNLLIQITDSSISIFDDNGFIDTWLLENEKITCADINHDQIIIIVDGHVIMHLVIQSMSIVLKNKKDMNQICNDLCCIHFVFREDCNSISLFLFASWQTRKIYAMNTHDLDIVHSFLPESHGMTRSIFTTKMKSNNIMYIWIGMSDGIVFLFELSFSNNVVDTIFCKKLELGSMRYPSFSKICIGKRIAESVTDMNDEPTTLVMILCDRPVLVYETHSGKFSFLHINAKDLIHMIPLFTKDHNPWMLFSTLNGDRLLIGNFNGLHMQNLHINTLPMPYDHEMPRRICYQESTQTFGILTLQTTMNGPSLNDKSHFRVYDAVNLNMLNIFTFPTNELVTCIVSIKFSVDSQTYFVVGVSILQQIPETTTINDDPMKANMIVSREEPESGRLYVFSFSNSEKKINLVSTTDTNGPIYSILSIDNDNDSMLLVSVQSQVVLYDWKYNKPAWKLEPVSSHYGQILPLHLATRNNQDLLIGDLMKSFSLLRLSSNINNGSKNFRFEELARDYHLHWITAMHILKEEIYLGAENACNLYLAKRQSNPVNDVESQRLIESGSFHIGELINQFRSGCHLFFPNALAEQDEAETKWTHPFRHLTDSILYCTASGSIGMISPISSNTYHILSQIIRNANRIVHGIGGLNHREWRTFFDDRRSISLENFIDGDYIESLLHLPTNILREIHHPTGDINSKGKKKEIQDDDSSVSLNITFEEMIELLKQVTYYHHASLITASTS